jgi:hypothetical protein
VSLPASGPSHSAPLGYDVVAAGIAVAAYGDSTSEFAGDAARWSSDTATDIKDLLRCIEAHSAGERGKDRGP